MRNDLAELLANVKPIEFGWGTLPCLRSGTGLQNCTAAHVRELALVRLIDAIESLPDDGQRPSRTQWGRRLRWLRQQCPELAELIEYARHCEASKWWLDVGYGPVGAIENAPFFRLCHALLEGGDNLELLRALAAQMLGNACALQKNATKQILDLSGFEESFQPPLPELKGSERQVAWARDLRRQALEVGQVSEAKARQVRRAKWWIEHGQENRAGCAR